MFGNPKDPGCICYGNFRSLVKDYEPFFNRRFRDHNGEEHTFFGIVWADDDLYYGMMNRYGVRLITCVGSLMDPQSLGWTLIEEKGKKK